MKKVLLLVLVLSFVFIGYAQAGIFEDAVKYVSERPVKAGISYDLNDDKSVGTIGAVLSEKGKVDIDLLVSGDDLDIMNDDDKTVSLGASYNLDLTPKTKLSLGASAGIKRFESFNNGDTGEAKLMVSALIKYKF